MKLLPMSRGDAVPLRELNRLAIPLAAALVPPGAVAPPMLAVPYYKQEEDNWCWAACCAMLIALLGKTVFTQCQMASKQFSQNCCANPGSTVCNIGCWPENAYSNFNVTITRQNSALSAAQIDAELSAGRAVEVYYAWTGGGAHVALITGKYVNGDYEVHDPYYGSGPRALSQITSAYGQGTWPISYVSIH